MHALLRGKAAIATHGSAQAAATARGWLVGGDLPPPPPSSAFRRLRLVRGRHRHAATALSAAATATAFSATATAFSAAATALSAAATATATDAVSTKSLLRRFM